MNTWGTTTLKKVDKKENKEKGKNFKNPLQ